MTWFANPGWWGSPNRAALDGGGAAYVGPGDIATGALGWWGLRAYSFATALPTTKAVTLFDVTATTSVDVFLKTDGTLDTSVLNGAHTYHVSTLYDQTGNGRPLAQATDAKRLIFNLSALNSLPTMSATSNTMTMDSTGGTAIGNLNHPITMSAVMMRTNTGNPCGFFDNDTFATKVGWTSSADKIAVASTTNQQASATGGHFHAVQVLVNLASSQLFVDGTSTPAVCTLVDPIWGGSFWINPGFDQPDVGNFTEFGFWNSDKSGDFSNLNVNQTTFWGPF
jgi:hypothetical protein